jgi:hypothetical protein
LRRRERGFKEFVRTQQRNREARVDNIDEEKKSSTFEHISSILKMN